jgi:hypothetical protein
MVGPPDRVRGDAVAVIRPRHLKHCPCRAMFAEHLTEKASTKSRFEMLTRKRVTLATEPTSPLAAFNDRHDVGPRRDCHYLAENGFAAAHRFLPYQCGAPAAASSASCIRVRTATPVPPLAV